MNELKIKVPSYSISENKKEENSDEEYHIIEEDYHSSPKCGIKSQIVKKSNKNISFSPVEISPKPYFKYSVTQIKEEEKNDNSKSCKKEKNINDNISISDEENKDEKETEEINYMQIIEKKSSELTVNMALKSDEINLNIKNENINRNNKKINNFLHYSLKSKDNEDIKIKFNMNNNKEGQDRNMQNSQTNIYNIFNNILFQEKIHSNNSNKIINRSKHQKDQNTDKDSIREKGIFRLNSINSKKDITGEKKNLPKNVNLHLYKNELFCLTANNIKKNKKSKKFIESDVKIKRIKSKINRQHSFIPSNIIDKKEKIHNEEKVGDRFKARRSLLITKEDNFKGNGNIFINILNNNINKNKTKKNKSKHQKMKSLEQKNNELLKFEKYNKRFENQCGTPKRAYNVNFKFKLDDKDLENTKNDMPKSTKGKRKVSIFDTNNIENKKRKSIFIEDKKNLKLFMKKKSNFNKDKFMIFKDKDKEKERKIKAKTSKRTKQKAKADKEKKIKKQSSNANQIIKKVRRRDKSFTIINKNLINDEDLNNNKNIDSNNNNESKSKLDNNENYNNIRNYSTKPSPKLNQNNSKDENNNSYIRRKSSINLLRDNEHKEKITAFTNKQIINNINEYIRQCLEVIPDLYDLGEKMPRCKTKINPNFSKNKKIALFDLDETIVHCIGEINMNNIESLSRQSDAKIKVYLPGGKREVTIGINIRPYWEEALNRIKDKYHIVAFTASHESYADPVLNYLDPNKKIFEYRLYRAHCVLCVIDEMKFYIKDLKILEDNYDLKNIVIIDNSVLSFAYHLDNGIPISPFYDSKSDTELLDIADFLVKYADENDIRDKLKEVYKLNEYLEILKYYSSTEENKEFSDLSGIDDINNKNKIEKKNMNISKPTDKLNQPLKENNTDNDNKVNKKQINIKRSNKNASKINIKLKEIYNMFDDKEIKEKNDKKNYSPKIKEHLTINQYMNKHLAKQNEMQVYNRFRKRSYRKTLILDINFKKQWEEKQKELKNKK